MTYQTDHANIYFKILASLPLSHNLIEIGRIQKLILAAHIPGTTGANRAQTSYKTYQREVEKQAILIGGVVATCRL